MSEVDARPPPTRGRSSARGGRGGFGRGGTRGARKQTNGATTHEAPTAEEVLEDQGELGEMKRKYTGELAMLKDMFADWTDVDLVFALQECDGDIAATVERITQGNVSQFSEVKKNKDRARSRVKEETAAVGTSDKSASGIRGGRGRGGAEASRGRGGRASDRGRGGHRGGRGGHATINGTSKDQASLSVPTTESSAWNTEPIIEPSTSSWDDSGVDATKGADSQSAWANVVTSEANPTTASEGAKSSLIPEGGPKKTWASMFSKPPQPAVVPKTTQPTQPPPAELLASGGIAPTSITDEAIETGAPEPAFEHVVPTVIDPTIAEQPPTIDESQIPPSKVPLTEENVEHLPDESIPPATLTVASTVDSNDPRNLTPLPGQVPIGRPPLGGYAASAYRATSGAVRSASFQRRVLEQQEAVVMPGHNAVDRAAVQFGSMGLNGEPEADVDDEREDPETRQAPQHSPPSQPKASLPPAPRQMATAADSGLPDALAATKQAPGLPPASQQNQPQMQDSVLSQGLQHDPGQAHSNYGQFGGYGQSVAQQDSALGQQKPYDPFSHQAQQQQFDRFGAQQQQPPQQAQQQGQSGFGGLSSAPHDYSSYYTSEPQRNAYGQYYGSSAGYPTQEHRGQPQQHDTGLLQQRSASGFGAVPSESGFGSQQQQQQAQARYGEAANSGHNTPNPHLGAQQQGGANLQQSAQSINQQGPSHQQQNAYSAAAAAAAAAAGYPYGHPYFNSPYQQAYQNQFGFNPYGAGYGSTKGGVYGGPQGYAMGSQSSYDQHGSSPANTGAFGQNQQTSMRSASGLTSGLGGSSLDEYGRGSAQQSGAHQANSGFGGMNDPFARSSSGLGQGSYGGQQTSAAGPEDSLKPFNDGKSATPQSLGQAGRPGSAANNSTGSTQPGMPPQQSHQSAFGGGGYQGYPGQGNQYGGLGGLGNHQQGQGQGGMSGQGGYGGYNAGSFGQYGSYNARGGWGQSYGAH